LHRRLTIEFYLVIHISIYYVLFSDLFADNAHNFSKVKIWVHGRWYTHLLWQSTPQKSNKWKTTMIQKNNVVLTETSAGASPGSPGYSVATLYIRCTVQYYSVGQTEFNFIR